MYSRYLILIVLIGLSGIVSYSQVDTGVIRQQEMTDDELIIQVGAFHHQSYAQVLKDKLHIVLEKTVYIVKEEGFFKVRIKGFSGMEEMEKFYSTLAFLGLRDFWVLHFKKHEEIAQKKAGPADTIIRPVIEKRDFPVADENLPDSTTASIVLQIDVFHNKSEALNAKKIITNKLNLSVEIVQVWKYYKVFVTGIHTREEADKYFIAIAKLGYPKISLIMNYNDIHKTDSLGTGHK